MKYSKKNNKEEVVEEVDTKFQLDPTTNYSDSQLFALEIFEVVSKEKIEEYEKEREELKLG